MSHATADLEYFMCDMCLTYVHRDIYCPHRRECKGKDSKELKKDEVAAIRRDIENGSHNYQQQQNLNNIGGCAARKSRFSAPVVNCGVTLAAAADKTSPNNNKQPTLATKRKDVIEQMATLGVRRELEGDAQGITALELVGGGGGGIAAPTSSCNNNTTNKEEEEEDLEEFFFGPK